MKNGCNRLSQRRKAKTNIAQDVLSAITQYDTTTCIIDTHIHAFHPHLNRKRAPSYITRATTRYFLYTSNSKCMRGWLVLRVLYVYAISFLFFSLYSLPLCRARERA